MTITALFPNGVSHYALGGLLIGVATALIFVYTGIRAGMSTFFSAELGLFSKQSFFKKYVEQRGWRLLLAGGVVLGAALYAWSADAWFTTDVQWWRLLAGGFLVGVGARTARGCTSGHGICGLAAGAKPSWTAVAVFTGVAIVTALLVRAVGVVP